MGKPGAFIAFALASSFALPSAADPQTTSRFRARLDLFVVGDPVPSDRCGSGQELVILAGDGNASGVGRVIADASHCVADDVSVPDFTAGLMTLVGRRGDLSIAYSGLDVAGDLSGTWTIVGGTGEYVGATGDGTFAGIADTVENRGVIRLDGTVTTP